MNTNAIPTNSPRLGTNQAGMRAFNERLVLSLVRQHGALAKSEIARMTTLSVQTVAVIMRQLEADSLLLRGEPVRGRVGQPSVPFSLNPEGAYFLGSKVGRRSVETVLVDFTGGIRHHSKYLHEYPDPQNAVRIIQKDAALCAEILGPAADRIAGLGIAMPNRIWEWEEAIGVPATGLESWQETDIRAELDAVLPYPVYLQNDATAACGAELAFGQNTDLQEFIYIYLGTFIGGGVVLNRGLYSGRTGNAGAIGSSPVPDGKGGTAQLIDRASLILLERRLTEAGLPSQILQDPDADWSVIGTALDEWLDMAAKGIAHAIVAAAAVLDFEAAVIDGATPRDVQERLIDRVQDEMAKLETSGIIKPVVRSGHVGMIARALGGSSLPLFDRFLVDRHTLSNSSSSWPK